MAIEAWILIFVLALIVLFLSLSLFYVIKRASYFSKKERDMLIFTIDMYIQYGEELNITSDDKHDIVIKELKKLRDNLEK